MSAMLTEPTAVTSSNYCLLPAGQFYKTRRGKIKAAVVHVTAGLQDLGMIGDDPSAEGTNRWALNSGVVASWYRIADSDGVESCLPSWYTAWQAKGYNAHTVGNECSNLDARWDNKPAEWVKWTIWHYARSYADWVVKYKIPMRRATKAELDKAIAEDGAPVGFVDHSRLSTNRSDPGSTFPWEMFFRFMRAIIAGATHPDRLTPTTQEDEVTPQDIKAIIDGVLGAEVVDASKIPFGGQLTPGLKITLPEAASYAMRWSLEGRDAGKLAAQLAEAQAAKGEALTADEVKAAFKAALSESVELDLSVKEAGA